MNDIYFYSTQRGTRADPRLFCLSNFARSPFILHDKQWATVEHYFQAAKFFQTEPKLAEEIRNSKTPAEAKKLGWKSRNISKDWDRVRDFYMKAALDAKFKQNKELKRILISTGYARLHEDSPRDFYWGVKGKDRLGQLLMQVRDEVRNEVSEKE